MNKTLRNTLLGLAGTVIAGLLAVYAPETLSAMCGAG